MKIKVFLTSLIAGASLFTANYTKPVYAGTCDDLMFNRRKIYLDWSDTWKIWTTTQQNLTSNNERKIEFAYKKLDLKADNELAKFVKTKVAGGMTLSGEERESYAVNAAGETTEDATEGFETIITELGSQADALLVGLQLIAECYTPGKELRVTKGINSESAIGAKRIENQDFGEGYNSTNSTTKTFRRDVQEGYSSYGNFENF